VHNNQKINDYLKFERKRKEHVILGEEMHLRDQWKIMGTEESKTNGNVPVYL